ATCDILIGADSIKSMVRMFMLQEQAGRAEQHGELAEAADLRNPVQPRWSGVITNKTTGECHRRNTTDGRDHETVTQYGTLVDEHELRFLQHIVAYPISHRKFINFAAFDTDHTKEDSFYGESWIRVSNSREIVDLFRDWEPEVKQLCIRSRKVNRWTMNVVRTLPSYASGRVAILGDAARAMTSIQAAGVGQAIEDAWIRSALLSHPLTTLNSVVQVLQIYSRIRLPLASQVAEGSRRNSMYFCTEGVRRRYLRG
ncbi:hypothetical protein HETIRDRAFT_50705, partial [Heterobasidion irregulare TC 32-1]